ncbi:MAG: choice-of-anchor D domain-containing protein, partial [Candidatus Kariarchaeaceae archaeon]
GSQCIDAGDPDSSYNDVCFPPSLGTERNDMGAHGGPGGCGWLSGLSVTPMAIDFGNVTIDSTSTEQIVVENTGDIVLDVQSLNLNGVNSSNFNVDTTPFQVPVGDNRILDVKFTPDIEDTLFASLDIVSSGGSASINLSGIGVLTDISVFPTSLNFGNVFVSNFSTKTFTINNDGTDTLRIASITSNDSIFVVSESGANPSNKLLPNETSEVIPNNFSYKNNPLEGISLNKISGDKSQITSLASDDKTKTLFLSKAPTSQVLNTIGPFLLPPGASKIIDVTFTPETGTLYNGSLSIFSNDPDENPFNVSLNGTGLLPDISVTPDSLNFGDVNVLSDSIKTVSVSNNGNTTLIVSSTEIVGMDSIQFSITSGQAPFTIPAGGNPRDIQIKFTPTSQGLKSAGLQIISNDPYENILDVPFSGAGVVPVIAVNPLSIDFGNVSVIDTTTEIVTVKNIGNGTLILNSISLSGSNPDKFRIDTTLFTLSVGDSVNLAVDFIPNVVGSSSASLDILSDGGNVSVSLSGTGIPANTIIVNSTADNGSGTMRQAMIEAVTGEAIIFDPVVFPPANPDTISLISSELPSITQGSITIDASNAGVILNGSALSSGNGFTITSNSNSIMGIQIINFVGFGIKLDNGANHNQVGGNKTLGNGVNGQGNTIGNCGLEGIRLTGGGTDNNIIQGNLIGTDVSGTSSMPNSHGIGISGVAKSNLIGGSQTGEGNLISGNSFSGIWISFSGADSNIIVGNLIGTNKIGTNTIPNGENGISFSEGVKHNTIGGGLAGERNIISGNTLSGIEIRGAGTDSNTVTGNYIGTDTSGVIVLSNETNGVMILDGAKYNQIGGRSLDSSNTIAYNQWNGVHIQGQGTDFNRINSNSIYSNDLQGIYLTDGANSGISAPIITSFIGISVAGTATPNAIIEFFADAEDEGKIFIDTTVVDGSGNFTKDLDLSGIPTDYNLTATQHFANNTSEFSFPLSIPPSTPQNLAAIGGNNQVILRWNPNNEPDLYKYNIYRGTSSPPVTLIDSVVVSSFVDTIYVDNNVIPDTAYYYHISAVDSSGSESSFSNEVNATPFEVTITVLTPNGGENWQVGTQEEISWTSVNVTEVKLEYSTDNGTKWITIIDSTLAPAGSFTWAEPNTLSKNSIENEKNWTTINASTPESSSSYSWKVSNKSSKYSIDNETKRKTIIGSKPEFAGSYNWMVPNTPSNQCKVRISDVSDSSVQDESDMVFTISVSAEPVLTVTPTERNVSDSSGITTFSVSNSGMGTMNWTAESDALWAVITGDTSGTNSGTITIAYEENTSINSRVATITVTSDFSNNKSKRYRSSANSNGNA